jgi:hypothetical protein
MGARVAGLALLVLVASGSSVRAQGTAQPQTHVFTVTTFNMPFANIDKYFALVDKYFSIDKENPHIVSEKYLVHDWGNADQTIWIIAEYKDLAEIDRAEEWNTKKLREVVPDSTARENIGQEFLEALGEGFSHHTDNILVGDLKRMK